MITGVFRVLCSITNKCYIGGSKDVKQAIKVLKIELRNGRRDTEMTRDWKKYGEQFFLFSIVEECELKDLNDKVMKYRKEMGGEYNQRSVSIPKIRCKGFPLQKYVINQDQIRV